MLNLNRAQILGNLTRDPEMRFTPNGQAVSSFSVATNRRWTNRDSGEQQEQVEFHNIVVWGKQAESVSPMLKKGQPVFVEGRLQTSSWEGQDGVKRYRTEIVAESVIVLSPRSSSGASMAETHQNPVEDVAKGDTKKEKNAPTKNDRSSDQSVGEDKKSDIDEKPKDDDNDKLEEINIEDIPF